MEQLLTPLIVVAAHWPTIVAHRHLSICRRLQSVCRVVVDPTDALLVVGLSFYLNYVIFGWLDCLGHEDLLQSRILCYHVLRWPSSASVFEIQKNVNVVIVNVLYYF